MFARRSNFSLSDEAIELKSGIRTSWNRTSMSQLQGPAGSGTSTSSRRWKERDRPILVYGLMLLAAVSLVLNYFIKFPTLPDETAASFREYLTRGCRWRSRPTTPELWSATLKREGCFRRLQILDSAMYTLKGGHVHRVLNRKASWIVYQNAEKRSIRLSSA